MQSFCVFWTQFYYDAKFKDLAKQCLARQQHTKFLLYSALLQSKKCTHVWDHSSSSFGSPLTVCVPWLAKRAWHPNQCNDYVTDNHKKIYLDQIQTPLENANCSYTSRFDVAGTLKLGQGYQKHTNRGSKWGCHRTKSERSAVNSVCQNSTVKFSTGPDIHSYLYTDQN